MVTQFATVDELNALHDTEFEMTDARINRLLQLASGMIQAEARQRIEYVADDVARLLVEDRTELVLPERPVTDLSAVSVAPLQGEPYPVDVALLTWYADGTITGLTTLYWPYRSEVTVTYSHGLEPVPDDVMTVCCSIVGRILLNSSPTYRPDSPAPSQSDAGVVMFSEEERELIRSHYRKRVYSARVGTGG